MEGEERVKEKMEGKKQRRKIVEKTIFIDHSNKCKLFFLFGQMNLSESSVHSAHCTNHIAICS
jgi:hypothetical protein